MSTHAPRLQWHDFAFGYGDERVLDGIDLDIRPGETVLVMGPSGCGKSTLGLTLNGIVPTISEGPASGRVEVGGVEPASQPLAETAATVGIVFQDPDAQLCTLTVRDEITFGPQNLLVDAEEILARLERLAALVGLSDRLDDLVVGLSGGQKQRLAIAATLASHPSVLVLDEPTANLDPAGRQEVVAILRELMADRAVTTVLVEHHPTELLDVVDRVVVLDQGRVSHDGPPVTLFATHGEELRAHGLRLPAATLLQLGMSADPPEKAALRVEDLDLDGLLGPPGAAAPVPAGRAAEHGTEPALELRGVRFAYPGGEEVLRGLDLHVRPGEVVSLLGANGAGKSTTGSLLAGLRRATGGTVTVGGRDLSRMRIAEIAAHVGYVFQYPEHQFVADTVLDEVAVSLRRLGVDAHEREVRARAHLERFDLAHLADRHPFHLSLGQKRRLSIAAMSVYRPEVLVLDEPTFGQDQAHTDDLAEVIRELQGDGVAVLMITHDLRLTAELSDRSVVLSRGRAVFDDTPEALLAHLHAHGASWGLWPSEEYAVWREVAARRPEVPFTPDLHALGHALAGVR